jgi:hypothetical protein
MERIDRTTAGGEESPTDQEIDDQRREHRQDEAIDREPVITGSCGPAKVHDGPSSDDGERDCHDDDGPGDKLMRV